MVLEQGVYLGAIFVSKHNGKMTCTTGTAGSTFPQHPVSVDYKFPCQQIRHWAIFNPNVEVIGKDLVLGMIEWRKQNDQKQFKQSTVILELHLAGIVREKLTKVSVTEP